MTFFSRFICFVVFVLTASTANAALVICNDTDRTQAVSIGYKGAADWTSEGWWNIEPGDCATPLGDDLTQRYYYFRAEADAGPFIGGNYFFCTTTTAYEIVGDTECEARGYDKEDFQEIDTGETGSEYTYRLTQTAMDVAQAGDGIGLEFCNESQHTQAISIAYQKGDSFISRGWWNVEPGECNKPLKDALQFRYYYYRAEVSAGDFNGEGYSFCTSPDAYDIIGDENCADRGYVSEDFAEIDTGESARGYTVAITDETGGIVGGDGGYSGLRVCNETEEAQEVSVGYQGDEDWTSEGWWRLEPGECANTIDGPLKHQYYYYRSEIAGGEFDGENYTFCTTPSAYTIVGDSDCESRGYELEKFREVNIGQGVESYVLKIGSSAAFPGGVSEATTASTSVEPDPNAGLQVCNETEHTQSLAFGYDGADGWTSEGWWVADAGQCVTPTLDGQHHRYIYYRAEVNGGPFEGQSYFFCTTSDAFTILGDDNCASRGYDREDFREIDTGSSDGIFTFTLVASEAGEAVEVDTSVSTNEESKVGGIEFDRNNGDAVDPEPETNPDPGTTIQPEPEPEPEPEEKAPTRRGGSRG